MRVVAELADELIRLRCRADVTYGSPSVVGVGVRYVAGAIRYGARRAEGSGLGWRFGNRHPRKVVSAC